MLDGDLLRALIDLGDLTGHHVRALRGGASDQSHGDGRNACNVFHHFASFRFRYFTMTLPCIPASRWPGIRQAYSNSPRLVKRQTSSPLLNGASRLAFGSSCSISGNFFITAACLRLSALLASMNS